MAPSACALSWALILLSWTSFSPLIHPFINWSPEYAFQMQISSCYCSSQSLLGALLDS